jgi:Tfp pilus assembly protein PilF
MRPGRGPRRKARVLASFGLLLAGLAIPLSGCALPQGEDRAQLFNDDGVHLFSQGDYRSALDSFDLALTLNPQDPGLLFNIAQCYDRLGDVKQAEQYYGYCLVRAPNHGDARLALVEMLYRTGRKPQADRIIEDYLRANPKSADALMLDGRRLREEKALPQAQGRLQQALDAEPTNRRALIEMAVLYEQLKMEDRALVLYERVLTREPNQAQVAECVSRLRDKGIRRPLPE